MRGVGDLFFIYEDTSFYYIQPYSKEGCILDVVLRVQIYDDGDDMMMMMTTAFM